MDKLKLIPQLYPGFQPMSVVLRSFRRQVAQDKAKEKMAIAWKDKVDIVIAMIWISLASTNKRWKLMLQSLNALSKVFYGLSADIKFIWAVTRWLPKN